MCSGSRSPAFGLTGVNGTPASSAPTAATHVSGRASANTATRALPATASATAAAAAASSAYVSARSPKRIVSLSEGSARGGSSALMAGILPAGRAGCAHPARRPAGSRSGDGVLDLVDEAAAVVGDDARGLLRQAGGLAQLLRDRGDLLGGVVRGEDVRLGREVHRRGAPRRAGGHRPVPPPPPVRGRGDPPR